MAKERRYIGSWELGCMVFNTCVFKIFTRYPNKYNQIGGSAGWITAAFTGIIFLGVLFAALTLMRKFREDGIFGVADKGGRLVGGLARKVFTAYWIASAAYGLREASAVLRIVSYNQSPWWFTVIFLVIGGGVVALCGGKAVYRMHSLLVLGIGAVGILIPALGLKYAEPLLIAPIFGEGPLRVFGQGLSTLFVYLDILFVFIILPYVRKEVKIRRTIMISAGIAVAVNIFIMVVATMSYPYELGNIVQIPIYPLTKTAYFGRFWSRLDGLYLAVFITSAMLFLSLAFHMIVKSSWLLNPKFSGKTAVAGVLAVIVCFSLTGCYDGKEVEEGAYMIGLGIDKGEAFPYKFTFQLSNPLKSGSSIDSGDSEKEGEEDGEKKEENKTVNNIVIEAEDLYTGINKLKSHLSKQPEFPHLKVIVFSKELAMEGILDEAQILYRERNIRPSVNLCMAESAEEFLKGVKPTLEQSTSRYYEMIFHDKNMPYVPVTELREFVSRSVNSGGDGVMPIADKDKLIGMGVFSDGKMVFEADGEKTLIYKILSGEAKDVAIKAGNSAFSVTCNKKPKIRADYERITIEPKIVAKLIYGSYEDSAYLSASLEQQMTDFAQECSHASADILCIGNKLRLKSLTKKGWESRKEESEISNIPVFTKSSVKIK